jgi:hypothetical protein
MFIQHHTLDGGAADVKTYSHVVFLLRTNAGDDVPGKRQNNFFAKN